MLRVKSEVRQTETEEGNRNSTSLMIHFMGVIKKYKIQHIKKLVSNYTVHIKKTEVCRG